MNSYSKVNSLFVCVVNVTDLSCREPFWPEQQYRVETTEPTAGTTLYQLVCNTISCMHCVVFVWHPEE